MSQPLCRLDALDDPGSTAVTWNSEEGPKIVMVVRRGSQVFGYVNSCPHTGAPLDWQTGRFLDSTSRHILCSMHGALFRPEDGFCIGGPCAGKSLRAVELEVNDGLVFVVVPQN